MRDVIAQSASRRLAARPCSGAQPFGSADRVGYSSAGTVVGSWRRGRLTSSLGIASHAPARDTPRTRRVACVPRLLVARIPEDATMFRLKKLHSPRSEQLRCMAFAPREVNLGDAVAVIGLGLLGQITVQMLKAAGCRVLGMDHCPTRVPNLPCAAWCRCGRQHCCTHFEICVPQCTRGTGVDCSAHHRRDFEQRACKTCRAKSRAIAPSSSLLERLAWRFEREAYYEKELDFRISRSYGPGRYDAAYEQKGRDYPIGHVRWTETRNMECVSYVAFRSGSSI